jgi:monothiol glutaredoxin
MLRRISGRGPLSGGIRFSLVNRIGSVGLAQSALCTKRWSSTTSSGVGGGVGTTSSAPLHSLPRDQLKTDVHRLCYDLIHSGRVVIFLTGTPEQPRCRFTRALCGLLEQIKLKYQYVDIMESDELCEGLKDYSGWPTYPQVYIDHELIGGYDVVKELVLNGSFTKMLNEKGLL